MIERSLTGAPPQMVLPKGAIDTHLHVYLPNHPAQPGGPALPVGLPGLAEYRQMMNWLGIERFVLCQGNAHQTDHGNLIEALQIAGEGVRGVAAINGATSDAEIKLLADVGVVGTRVVDLPGGAVGFDQLDAVEAQALAAGWVAVLQFDGSTIADHFDRLKRMRCNWVLDHHGKFLQGVTPDGPEVSMVKRLLDTGKCWFKFCACYESSQTGAPDYADVAVIARDIASHAPDRIVWGSNFPHNMAQKTADYPNDAALLDTVLGWLPDREALQKAVVTNPAYLFQF